MARETTAPGRALLSVEPKGRRQPGAAPASVRVLPRFGSSLQMQSPRRVLRGGRAGHQYGSLLT